MNKLKIIDYAILACFVIDHCSTTLENLKLPRTFVADYENDVFLKDDNPYRFISGSVHYYQIPSALWRDRLERSRALGVDAVQTCVSWNRHEPREGRYNFEKDANLTEFLDVAKNLNLLVILRIGPYICSEQDFGGLPYWLLKYPEIFVRSSTDERYLEAVRKWFSILLPKIRPMLYANGGPVIMVQLENEYGSYGCDLDYKLWLKAEVEKYLQDQVVYFTTDYNGEKNLKCGQIPGALSTVDFGALNQSSVQSALQTLRRVMPKGPLVNSEFYPGWFDWWGKAPSQRFQSSKVVTEAMGYIWGANASFNIYPVHGGTNWGYQAGAECCPFLQVGTSYDFDAPLSEAGDVTGKFLDMRQTVERLKGRKVEYPIPKNSSKTAYGKIQSQYMGDVFDLLYTLSSLSSVRRFEFPLTMEQLDQPFGFVMYQSQLGHDLGELAGGYITVKGIHDRAYVMIDYQLVDVIQRTDSFDVIADKGSKIPIPPGVRAESALHILVENQGRIDFGPNLNNDSKGLLSNVTFGDADLLITGWTMFPLKLENLYGSVISADNKKSKILSKKRKKSTHAKTASGYVPSFYLGYLMPDNVTDTFFDPTGWGKGQLLINGVNIGRYWPQAGPQVALYVPACYLSGFNQIIIFELDHPGNCASDNEFACAINFIDHPLYKD